jgi:hypothetical protein
MSGTKDEQIVAPIERLSNDIGLAQKLSLAQTARLREMAKLDLRMLVHAISDEELRLFGLGVEETRAFMPFPASPAPPTFDLKRKDRSRRCRSCATRKGRCK